MKLLQSNKKDFFAGLLLSGLLIVCIVGLLDRAHKIQSQQNQIPKQQTKQESAPASSTVEISTKKVVDMPNDTPCEWITKDQNQVYYGDTPIRQADPDTFRIIGYWMVDDFEYYPVCIGVDKNHVYANTGMLPDLDPTTTEVIYAQYIKDKNGMYSVHGEGATKIPNVDLATFTGTEDKNTLYGCGQAIAPNTPTTKILGNSYAQVGNTIYYKNTIVAGADAKSFSVLLASGPRTCESSWGGYAIDSKNAYYRGKKIPGADPKSFKTTDEIGIAYDKNAEYIQGEPVKSEFQSCSSDPKNLPSGKVSWITKLPALSNTSTKIEFCLTPDKDILLKYTTSEEERLQNIDLFNAKGELLRSKEMYCAASGENFPFSIRSLNGSIATVSCFEGDACGFRAFYEFNLNTWKTNNTINLQRTQEEYDCGYRG